MPPRSRKPARPKPLYFKTRAAWRAWLARNHASKTEIWLLYYKKHTGKPTVPYDDAVEEALCFGWIDSTVRRLDNRRFCQKFVPRRERSSWSGHNRRRAEALIASGAMTAAGMAKVEAARANGEWEKALKDRVDRPVPKELEDALAGEREAAAGFGRLTPTQRKYFIHWIDEAKRPETRARRAARAVEMILAGKRPGM